MLIIFIKSIIKYQLIFMNLILLIDKWNKFRTIDVITSAISENSNNVLFTRDLYLENKLLENLEGRRIVGIKQMFIFLIIAVYSS